MSPFERKESPEVAIQFEHIPKIKKGLEEASTALDEIARHLSEGGQIGDMARHDLSQALVQYESMSGLINEIKEGLQSSEK